MPCCQYVLYKGRVELFGSATIDGKCNFKSLFTIKRCLFKSAFAKNFEFKNVSENYVSKALCLIVCL